MSTEKITESEIFSERLKSLRKSRRKAAFAAFLDTSPQNYGRYEQGRVPSSIILKSIANRCGVSVDWLLGRDDTPPPKVIYGAAAESALAKQDQAKKAAWAKLDDAVADAFVDTCYDMSKLISTGRSVNHASEVIREQLDAFVEYGQALENAAKKG